MVSKDDIDLAFDSTESLLDEASESLQAFKDSLDTFFFTNKPSFITDFEPKTGHKIVKLRFPSPRVSDF